MIREIQVSPAVKDILNQYDENDILSTIPEDYSLSLPVINIYENKIKNKTLITEIDLTEQSDSKLKNIIINNNADIKPIILFNYLIEIQADLSKINSKKVKQALNFYYDAVENNKPLFSQILEGFANSPYYEFKDAEGTIHEGLTEEGVVKFLIFTQERTEFIKK